MSLLDRMLNDAWQLIDLRQEKGFSKEPLHRMMVYLTTVISKMENGGANADDWNSIIGLADDAGLKEEITTAREAVNDQLETLWKLLNRIHKA